MVLPTKSGSFGKTVSEEKIIKKSTNQKTELLVTAMFANGSVRNGQSLKIQKCSVLKALCAMNRNLVGCIYGRSSISKAHFVPIP
jgi:hypothetical protein